MSAGTLPDPPDFRCGYVSLLGLPNAGKSTLMNALLGAKVAIVTDKPQTTRNLIQGVVTDARGQIIFLDTPGIHAPRSALNRRMMEAVTLALEARDLLLLVVDATRKMGDADLQAVRLVAASQTPALLVLNKIDLLKDKAVLLPLMDAYRQQHSFEEYLPVSAVTGEGLEELRAAILARLPRGEKIFPDDYLTNQPERFLAAELIRERLLIETRQEVPHSVAVVVEQWEETPQLTRISAVIYVERPSQKAIVIGAKGSMLKKVGTLARQEIEALLGRKVFLEMFVKVKPGWRDSPSFLKELEEAAHASREESA